MALEIKNTKKGAERILEAVATKEKIILYGDADLDGVSSVVILKEALDILGNLPVQVYFPDREKEAYGLNKEALKFLDKFSPALLITLDCGIGNVEEIGLAKKMGLEVIIIDHHEALKKLPPASIIVDPKQPKDKYPFKYLAAGGVAYKFSKFMLSLAEQKYRPEKFLELALLATLYDKVPLKEENEKLVKQGIDVLSFTERRGLKVLMEKTSLDDFNLKEIQEKIITPLSAAKIKNHLSEAYSLLIEKNKAKSEKIADILIKRAKQKREKQDNIFKEVESRLEFKPSKALKDFLPDGQSIPIVFEGDSSWPLIMLGSVASRISQAYDKPCFLFKKGKSESSGSVRMPKGLDAVKAMASCESLLITYGGHAPAAGFRIKNKNLKKFKEGLIKYFNQPDDL